MRRSSLAVLFAVLFTLGCACEDTSAPVDASSTRDAQTARDAGRADAGAADASGRMGPSRFEVTSGAARLEGSTFRMEVQVGHPIPEQRIVSASRSLAPAPVVEP